MTALRVWLAAWARHLKAGDLLVLALAAAACGASVLALWQGGRPDKAIIRAGGKVFLDWVEEVTAFVAARRTDPVFERDCALLEEALQTVVGLAMDYGRHVQEGRLALIPLTSTRFLDCMAEVAIAHLLLEQGIIAQSRLDEGGPNGADAHFYRGKVETVRYYCRNFLPQVFGRARILRMEDMTAIRIREEDL